MLKEIKIRPRIEEHDLQVKIKNINRLLTKHEVKVDLIFRGREIVYIDAGEKILDRIIEDTEATVVSRSRKGNISSMFLVRRRVV